MQSQETRFMVLYGIAGWFGALLLIRILGPVMFDQGLLHISILVIACLLGWPALWLAAKILNRSNAEMTAPVVCFTVTAMLCDGIALSFTPWAYGPVGVHTGFAGGTILFGAAWGIVVAGLYARRSQPD